MSDVRDALKDIIEEKGYKRKVIAEKAHLTPYILSSVLNKNRRLDVNELVNICKALEIEPAELMHNVYASEAQKEIS